MTAASFAPARFVTLHSQHSTLVLETPANEAPLWRYWGPRLPDSSSPEMGLRSSRPMPSFMLDFDQPLTLVPTFGVGWFGQSALLAHRAGLDFAQAITACEVEWLEPQRSVVFICWMRWRNCAWMSPCPWMTPAMC
jgi:alpha-galactosidase